MRLRDAERKARRFIHERYSSYEHWIFDICFEHASGRSKSWSFGLEPDEEDPDYQPGKYLVGYVHADGVVEGMY